MGGLYGFGKTHIPAISLAIGAVSKLIINIVLISNPYINVMGAVISSIVCQIIVFVIDMHYLRKEIKLQMNIKQHILKPTFASILMGGFVYLAYILMENVFRNSVACIASILIGIIVYIILVFAMKILSKEDIYMIPYGTKIYDVLVKLKIYKE